MLLARYIGGQEISKAAFQVLIESLKNQMRMTRRSPRLVEVAVVAVFLASYKADAITDTVVDVTSETFPARRPSDQP